jgi:EAL domain-containing protein (putative c-di-GMP-specific phosphodiesterase class I)
VSRASQIDVLRALGCDGVQGPACGPDLSEAELLRWGRTTPKAAKLARA